MPIPSFTVATTPATFEAYEYYKFGNALEEIKFNANTTQKPLKADELRVKIFSAAVNPVDYKLVVEIGSDVKDYKVGDERFAMAGFVSFGTFGEYVNTDTKFVAPKPSNMSWNEAAGVPLAGQTGAGD
ncbi:hypothetical protein JG687_00019547, partial [Phytophthora cactorum]